MAHFDDRRNLRLAMLDSFDFGKNEYNYLSNRLYADDFFFISCSLWMSNLFTRAKSYNQTKLRHCEWKSLIFLPQDLVVETHYNCRSKVIRRDFHWSLSASPLTLATRRFLGELWTRPWSTPSVRNTSLSVQSYISQKNGSDDNRLLILYYLCTESPRIHLSSHDACKGEDYLHSAEIRWLW